MADIFDEVAKEGGDVFDEITVGRGWSDVPGEALKNTPRSAVNFGKSIIHPLLHPVQTIENISSIGSGALGLSSGEKGVKDQAAWNATKQFFVDRYGGEEELKNTIATDPVGFLADVSTVLTAGGSLAAKVPGTAGKIGQAARMAGEYTNPLAATKLLTTPVKYAMKEGEVPERIMEGVVKYPVPMKGQKRHGMVETQFKYGLDPTSKDALPKLQELVTDMNVATSQMKAMAANSGKTVPLQPVIDAIDGVIVKWSKSDQPEKYMKQLVEYRQGLLKAYPQGAMNVSDFDTFVTNLQGVLKPDLQRTLMVNQTAKETVMRDVQMAVHDAAKKELAKATGIGELNAEQSRLLGLQPFLEKASNRIRNYNTITLTDMLTTGPASVGTYLATNNPYYAMGAAIVTKFLTHPGTHAKIAMALKNGIITSEQAGALRSAALAARSAGVLTGEEATATVPPAENLLTK